MSESDPTVSAPGAPGSPSSRRPTDTNSEWSELLTRFEEALDAGDAELVGAIEVPAGLVEVPPDLVERLQNVVDRIAELERGVESRMADLSKDLGRTTGRPRNTATPGASQLDCIA